MLNMSDEQNNRSQGKGQLTSYANDFVILSLTWRRVRDLATRFGKHSESYRRCNSYEEEVVNISHVFRGGRWS